MRLRFLVRKNDASGWPAPVRWTPRTLAARSRGRRNSVRLCATPFAADVFRGSFPAAAGVSYAAYSDE